MAVFGVGAKEYLEELRYGLSRRKQSKEPDSFSKDMWTKEEERAKEPAGEPAGVPQGAAVSGLAANLFMQKMERQNLAAVTECSVRHLSCQESDQTRAYPEEGYLWKAQVDVKSQLVYVEQKNEDGTFQAYQVNPFLVSEQAKSPITQIAMEAWVKVQKAESGAEDEKEANPEIQDDGQDTNGLTAFEKQLLEFKEFVMKRLKDGPPKIPTGGSEFTEEEWKNLLRKIDRDIDAYKQELRERIRKRKEAEAIHKSALGAAGQTDDEEETIEGKVSMSAGPLSGQPSDGELISENEALEGIELKKPRGSSLFARLSGVKKAPYSYLADESGTIVYKGVTFFCDDEKGQICLGDMSNPKNVINIPLAKGGCLRVNRENIGDLAKAISMFSAEDIGRIMRAIAQDKKVQEVEWELEASEGRGV